jgi:hypothetical protein
LGGEKTDQRCFGFSFNRWRAQSDLNRAAMLADDAVYLRIRNDMNPQSCHSADYISAEVNSLDGLSCRMP